MNFDIFMKLCIYSDVSNDLSNCFSIKFISPQISSLWSLFMIGPFHPGISHLFAPNWIVHLLFSLAVPL